MNLYGHRRERFVVELLDLNDAILGTLDGVQESGQLDYSIAAAIRASGNLSLLVTTPIDWLTHRVRVSYLLGEEAPVPLITGIPQAPVEEHTDTGTVIDLELFDKTLILSDDAYAGGYGLPEGTNVLDAVRAIIASTGEPATSLVAPTSTITLARPMVWDAGTSKLRVINDLLDAAGFFALYADGWGKFRADAYVPATSRPIAWTFADDERGLYLPDWRRDRDTFSVPNRYVCVGRTDGDEDALVAEATDTDPDSPYSYPARGRWITRTDLDVEAADQTVLDSLAARRLADAQGVSETLELEHPWLPSGLNSAVEFTHQRLDGRRRAVVQKQTIKLTTGGLITTTLRSIR